jgi:osmotically-inducible protein OsmY
MKIFQTANKQLRIALSIACVSLLPLSLAVFSAGCAGDRYHESTGEDIDDTAITARVKKALHEDSQYKFDDVKVSTFKGTTQLSGFADSRDAKNRAGEIAKNVEGVKNLENNITVKQ